MKQFATGLSKDGDTFKYLASNVPGLSEAKLKERLFVGSDIQRLMKDGVFENRMEDIEKSA